MKMPGVFIYRIVALIASARAGFTGMAIIGQRWGGLCWLGWGGADDKIRFRASFFHLPSLNHHTSWMSTATSTAVNGGAFAKYRARAGSPQRHAQLRAEALKHGQSRVCHWYWR